MAKFFNQGYGLNITREPIEITSIGPRRDPNWEAVDSHNHLNTWETVRWHTTEIWFDYDGDEHTEGYWVCPQCGFQVYPEWLPPTPYREFIPGPVECILTLPTGEERPITEEEAQRLLNAPQEQWATIIEGEFSDRPAL